MTIARAVVAAYLDEQFSSLAASVGQDADVSLGYAPDIDNALRKLGTSEGDLATATVADSDRDAYFALAEYFAARRFWRQLGDRVDTTTGETSYKFDGQRKQAKEMMEDAKARCATLGYDMTGDAWGIAQMNLDWIEPVAESAV